MTRRSLLTLAFAENRQFNGFNGNTNAYLAEAVSGITTRSTLHGRAEVAGKELFGVSPHEKQYAHRHWISTIGAFTVGYSHLLPAPPGRPRSGHHAVSHPDRPRELLRAVSCMCSFTGARGPLTPRRTCIEATSASFTRSRPFVVRVER